MRMLFLPGAAWACALAGAAVLEIMLWKSLQRQGKWQARTAWTLLLPLALGIGLGRAGFEILQVLEDYSAFQWTFRWCYTAGMAGLSLGIWACARLCGAQTGRTLDETAAALCLAMAAARGAQRWLGETGMGPILDAPGFWAMMNDWDEPVLAVWMIETGICLLAAAAAAWLARRKGRRPGSAFAGATCLMMALQILAEQFRSGAYLRFMMMRLEQILYLIWLLCAMLWAEKALARKGRGLRNWGGAAALLLMAGGIAAAQFMLDGKLLPEWPKAVGWTLYGLMIAGMAALCLRAALRKNDGLRTGKETRQK